MKVARTQPPVGYRFPMAALLRGAFQAASADASIRDVLERELADHFRLRHVVALSSGKAALTIILIALKALTGRRKVILPAYTCYSVPSAIVKAGLDMVPCDIARNSFDYDYDRLRTDAGRRHSVRSVGPPVRHSVGHRTPDGTL